MRLRGALGLGTCVALAIGCESFHVDERVSDDGVTTTTLACTPPDDGRRTLFCDDFETTPFASSWDDEVLRNGGPSTERKVSGSTSMRLSFDTATDTSDTVYCDLDRFGERDFRLELDMYVERQTGNVIPFGFLCTSYQLAYNAGGRVIEGGSSAFPYRTHQANIEAPVDRWAHYALTFRRTARTFDFELDGTVVLPGVPLDGTEADFATGCRVVVGAYFAHANSTWTGYYDDVRVSVP